MQNYKWMNGKIYIPKIFDILSNIYVTGEYEKMEFYAADILCFEQEYASALSLQNGAEKISAFPLQFQNGNVIKIYALNCTMLELKVQGGTPDVTFEFSYVENRNSTNQEEWEVNRYLRRGMQK